MRDGQKVFTHGVGVIIVSVNQQVTRELQTNKNFFQYAPPHNCTSKKIFVSMNLAPEIIKTGLPHNVLKFLVIP